MRILALGALALVACGNAPEAEAPQNPTPNPQYPAAPPAATTAPPPAATTAPAPTPTVAATQPAPAPPAFPTFQLPSFQLPSAAQLAQALPALPLDPNLLAQIKQVGQQLMNQGIVTIGDPTDLGMKAAAIRYAPLMLPEGAAYKDTIAAGGHKAFDVTLAGNKCYTIIGYSPPGNVTDVELHLLVPPFYNMDAGHDSSTSSTAVIGNVCPFTLIPIPYRVDVSARSGQGQVAVQVYSKSK